MRITEIIEKKRDGGELSPTEIKFFVDGYTAGDIPDYQASALLMAITIRGMNDRETSDLTLAMAFSGEVLSMKDVAPFVVDKHSTGGVGDKVTLIVAPIAAAAGVPVGKMSGRGLGFSGGTLDKLESIPGFRTMLTIQEFKQQLGKIGLVVAGQSANLAPADGKLYALRDVTGTVPSLPLIVGSVMSKKIAAGADAIVLDVKMGSGAFMKTLEDAHKLAEAMVAIGIHIGRKLVALISDMNQPLGTAIGNVLEVREVIEILHGGGPQDLLHHCLVVAGEMITIGGKANTAENGARIAAAMIESGDAWKKFRQMVSAQDGNLAYIDHPERMASARTIETILSPTSGYLAEVRADAFGMACLDLGGGREKKGEPIDHAVGLVMPLKVGDHVEKGAPLFSVHANDEGKKNAAIERVLAAIHFSDHKVEPLPLFYGRVV